jgi:hypothetical protein
MGNIASSVQSGKQTAISALDCDTKALGAFTFQLLNVVINSVP